MLARKVFEIIFFKYGIDGGNPFTATGEEAIAEHSRMQYYLFSDRTSQAHSAILPKNFIHPNVYAKPLLRMLKAEHVALPSFIPTILARKRLAPIKQAGNWMDLYLDLFKPFFAG